MVKLGEGNVALDLSCLLGGADYVLLGFPIKSLSPNKILQEKIHCSCQI